MHRLVPAQIIGAALIALVVTGALYTGRFIYAGVTAPPLPAPGEIAPQVTMTSIEGEVIDFAALRGKIVVLDFWATWCSGCVAALPNLRRIAERHAGDGVVVIGLNQEPEAREHVRRFVADRELGYPIVLDDGALFEQFRVRALPTVVLIDQAGVVRGTWERGVTEELLEHRIRELLDRA